MIRRILMLSTASASLLHALPPDAADLKAKRDYRVAEIDRVYAAELAKLQKRAMDSGNLTAANEIQKEIETVTPNPFADDDPTKPKTQTPESKIDERLKPLVGVWKRDTDNGVWKITDTAGGVFNGNLPFTMSFDAANNRVAVVGSHWADFLSFTTNPDVVNGSTKINGKTVRYKLKRIK